MARRKGARKLALHILYERDVSGRPIEEIMPRYASGAAFEFAAALVRGVMEHLGALDALLARYAEGWTVDRMPAIDRNLLRLGVFEILHLPDVPPAVTISEAVELAKRYSTGDSSRFVNGVLGRIAEKEGTPV